MVADVNMGGTESVHLAIFVETPKVQACYFVTGVIYLYMRSSIQAKSLQLKLAGKQECQWTDTVLRSRYGRGRS